jgi:membrane-associated phospholipid phosphatase
MTRAARTKPAKPLLKLDKQAKDLFEPYQDTLPVRALATVGQAGDQLQLRLICGGVFLFGLVRKDTRLMGAAVRMIVAHEVATLAKGVVKGNVDRRRPRSTQGSKASMPHAGSSKAGQDQSFPSGHTAGSTAVAHAFAAVYPEYRTPALAASAAVSLIQVPTCAHYPSDVMAGTAIGVASDRALGAAWRLVRQVWRINFSARPSP